jgi:hypothetical protein
MKKLKNEVINNWLQINTSVGRLSLVNLIQVIANSALIVFAIILYSKDPIVAMTNGKDTVFYQSVNSSSEIKEGTIKRHVKEYINLRYKWDALDHEKIFRSLVHLTTTGFNRKTYLELKKLKEQFKGTLSQSITEVDVIVTKTKTIAKFDRVLRVNNIPLLIPTQMSFEIIKGSRHAQNPAGLEINGVTIHEERK